MLIDRLTTTDYLFSTNDKLKYWYIYLPTFGLLIVLAFLVSYLVKRQKDYKAKAGFQRQFFWIYLTFGLLGLTSVFARSQALPVFGSRFLTFLIIFTFILCNLWLFGYYFKVTKKEKMKLANKLRKEKWLKKK